MKYNYETLVLTTVGAPTGSESQAFPKIVEKIRKPNDCITQRGNVVSFLIDYIIYLWIEIMTLFRFDMI